MAKNSFVMEVTFNKEEIEKTYHYALFNNNNKITLAKPKFF